VARDQPGSEFTDQDVSGNIFTALLAGEDTTANTLAWLCHYLCDHPQVQMRMAAEADAMLAGADVITRFEQAAQAPYIDAATREAMRLKPVAPVLFFESNEATRVGDIEIAARTPITTLMRPPAIDEAVFPDALAFRPERWLAGGANETETAESKRALMPFGGGPRFCPGRYLALLEIRMVASMLVHNFSLQRRPGTRATERYNLSMMPEGLWVQLEERTQAATRLSPA
jgi:cytochrome P450